MKTVEHPLPELFAPKEPVEEEAITATPADFDLVDLTATEATEEEPPESLALPEPVRESSDVELLPKTQPEPITEIATTVPETFDIPVNPPAPSAEEPDQLDKIIDEAIAIFEEEIVEDKKSAESVPAASIPETPAMQFTEPVPGAEVKLDNESRFGKYKLMEKIAVGGMAEMWKAKQIGPEGFEKVVALKRILPSLSENEDFITMFIDEGKVAAQLTHPNIAQIYELGETMGGYYLAMEYIAGKDLRTIMRLARKEKKNLAIPQAVIIAAKLLSGLNYAHRKKGFNNENLNIVHRDVSPQNVLISYEGEVKLVDFGIAKAAAKNSVTLTGALKGKILYMSPEQAWGQAVDRRSDVFSVGTLLYEMLTGKRVFIADNEMAILQKVREWNPPPPSAANARISSRLDAIVLKSIEKDPDKRYQTAEEMREDLDAYLHAEKPPKNLMDLGLFMRTLFKDEIHAEMPEILEIRDDTIDPFEMEKAFEEPIHEVADAEPLPEEPPAVIPSAPIIESIFVEPPPPTEMEEKISEDIISPPESSEFIESPADIESSSDVSISPDLVPSAATQRDKRKKSSRKDKPRRPAPPITAETPKPVEKTPPPAAPAPERISSPVSVKPQKEEIVIDEDFLKPSRSAGTDKKKMLLIGGGAGAIVFIIVMIMLFSGGGKKEVAVPVITPTPTTDLQAVANTNTTATAVAAISTETPTPSPTETSTPRTATRVTLQDADADNTATPTQTPVPTDTPVPTQTPTSTITPSPTQTPVQLGAYIQYPDVKPEALTKVTPEMPKAARQMGVEGNITLQVLVSETGEVLDIEILRAGDQLEKSGCVKAAQDAVMKWVFQPATHKGVPVKTHVNLVLPFRRK